MEVSVIKNPNNNLGQFLIKELDGACLFRVASAYMNYSGLNTLINPIERILAESGAVSVIHGADFHITDPDTIKTLSTLNTNQPTMTYRVRVDWTALQNPRFHPKLYLTSRDLARYVAVIGSSNVTHSGLFENVEINTILEGDSHEQGIGQCISAFDSLLQDRDLVEPNGEFYILYNRLFEYARSHPLRDEPPAELRDLYRNLLEYNPKPVQWKPKNQLDFVIFTLQNLEHDVGNQGFDLGLIQSNSKLVAQESNVAFNWDAWNSSVRRCLNTNTKGKAGLKVFERVGGENSRSGIYKLTQKGMNYNGKG